MKINSTKLIPYLIVIVPLVLVLSVSFFITTFYINKVTNYFAQAKENSIHDYIDTQKAESELRTEQLILLFEYTNNRVEPSIKKELSAKVNLAFSISQKIYNKYKGKKSPKEIKQRIKDTLSELSYDNKQEYIFITDFDANAILNGSHLLNKEIVKYRDADDRAIILEEIQKVRRHHEGYIRSRREADKLEEIIYVKELGIYNWYIGSSIRIKAKQQKLEDDLLEMVKSIPIEKSDFIAVFQKDTQLYKSNDFHIPKASLGDTDTWHKHQIKDYYYFSKYYEPFDWTLVYGFNTTTMSKLAKEKHEQLEELLSTELAFIIKVSAGIIIIIVLLSLLLSFKINKIFKQYQDEVENRRGELERLNSSLEMRVLHEVREHRQKDKMLTQSSKMAEMGDMLSMIAHQWRQPLNQMSYVVMNIESAYEYDELTKEYLDTKVKEANELLEFMSVTIDDFKNYFSPDKEKSSVLVEDVINQALSLIKKTLESENIQTLCEYKANKEVSIYKNEFIQVLLNLIKNARDVLRDLDVENPQIIIRTSIENDKILVEVIDNGKGIKEELQSKIFEPYFSTKDEKNGTGLGLYMSKMIIEGHLGGKLSASNTDDGANFTITLPMA